LAGAGAWLRIWRGLKIVVGFKKRGTSLKFGGFIE